MAFRMGLMLGLSLIMAIGAQNIFVIKQGIKREYAFTVALLCLLADGVLILLSVTSLSQTVTHYPTLRSLLLIGAIIFLCYYGFMALRAGISANTSPELEQQDQNSKSLRKIAFLALCFSLLNPHAIIDTLILMGGLASQFPSAQEQYQFAAGAIVASAIWFISLSTISTSMSGLLRRPRVWQGLELLSGLLMFSIAIKVLVSEFLMVGV